MVWRETKSSFSEGERYGLTVMCAVCESRIKMKSNELNSLVYVLRQGS